MFVWSKLAHQSAYNALQHIGHRDVKLDPILSVLIHIRTLCHTTDILLFVLG